MIFIIYLLNLLYADILGKFWHFEYYLGSIRGEKANLKVKTGSVPISFLELWGVRDLANLWLLESTVNLSKFENVKMIQLIIVAYCSNSDHESIDNFQCYFIQLAPGCSLQLVQQCNAHSWYNSCYAYVILKPPTLEVSDLSEILSSKNLHLNVLKEYFGQFIVFNFNWFYSERKLYRGTEFDQLPIKILTQSKKSFHFEKLPKL